MKHNLLLIFLLFVAVECKLAVLKEFTYPSEYFWPYFVTNVGSYFYVMNEAVAIFKYDLNFNLVAKLGIPTYTTYSICETGGIYVTNCNPSSNEYYMKCDYVKFDLDLNKTASGNLYWRSGDTWGTGPWSEGPLTTDATYVQMLTMLPPGQDIVKFNQTGGEVGTINVEGKDTRILWVPGPNSEPAYAVTVDKNQTINFVNLSDMTLENSVDVDVQIHYITYLDQMSLGWIQEYPNGTADFVVYNYSTWKYVSHKSVPISCEDSWVNTGCYCETGNCFGKIYCAVWCQTTYGFTIHELVSNEQLAIDSSVFGKR